MNHPSLFLLLALLMSSVYTFGQKSDSPGKYPYGLSELPETSTTQHRITVNGEEIAYTAKTGYLTLTEENGKDKAHMFYIAYLKDGVEDPASRPITYTFNGGPGSSSVWLHMGGLGPKRIVMTEKGDAMAPPYKLVDNEYSWLEQTDLVFIDPVMTGYSRPAKDVDKKEFLGFREDVSSVGEFIYRFTTENQRWGSPKFLAGESYGTTRAAGLSAYLQDRYGLFLNGIVMISAITNFQTARFNRGNDLPFILFLPTYSAIAWYHGQLNEQYDDLTSLLREVEEFAMGEYTFALMQGDRLSEEVGEIIVQKLARYTGLSEDYIRQTRMRINISRFVKELLREEGKTVGRLDGRFQGEDYDDAGERYEYDPSYSRAIYGPYTTAIHDYLGRELKFNATIPYEILTARARPWNYSNVQNEYLNVSENLREAMTKNPYLKVLICNGYYDLATPYFATDYTVSHMLLPEEQRDNVRMTYYEAGHMMYIHKPSLEKFKKDVKSFYLETLKAETE